MNFKGSTHTHTQRARVSPALPFAGCHSGRPHRCLLFCVGVAAWAWLAGPQHASVCSLSMIAPCGWPASSFFLSLPLLLSFYSPCLPLAISLRLRFQFGNPSLTCFQVAPLAASLHSSFLSFFSCIINCYFHLSLAAALLLFLFLYLSSYFLQYLCI